MATANIDLDNIEPSAGNQLLVQKKAAESAFLFSVSEEVIAGGCVGLGLIRSHLALECVAGWAGVWGGGQLEVLSPVQAAEHTGTNNPPHPHTSCCLPRTKVKWRPPRRC